MMTIRNFARYMSAEPFRPFRIKMVSGQSFEIRHPEMIEMGRSSVRVYRSQETDADGGEQWHDVSMLLMETLEPV